jgi:hypothetical protein
MNEGRRIEQFYTVTERMSELYQKEARAYGWTGGTTEELEAWRVDVKLRLHALLGLGKMESCPLQPVRLESIACSGYTREKWIIQTEPGVHMPFFLLIPEEIRQGERKPAFIEPHGHLGGKFYTAGASDYAAVQPFLEQAGEEPFAVQLVREGYLVACPDARGAGERREWMKQEDEYFLKSTCTEINHMAISLGRTLTGMMVWDLIRLLDYMETREDCDPVRIGCGGMSGGGMQTLWLAALDDRIRAAVVSGYFYGFHDAHLVLSHNCGCNFVPNLWATIDMGDLGALIAPRHLFIETGDKDHLNGRNGLANVYPQVEIARSAYRTSGAESGLVHHVFDGGHEWNGVLSLPFVLKYV